MPTVYRGKSAKVNAIDGDNVTIELAYNHQEYVIDWGDRDTVWTLSPTTVVKTVGSNGTLYLSETWLTHKSIPYSGDPKYPANLGAVGVGSWPPVHRVSVPVVIEAVTPRISVLGDDGALRPSAPVPDASIRGPLRGRGAWSQVELSGRWLYAQGLRSAPDDGFHPARVMRSGEDVAIRLGVGGGELRHVNLDDTACFAPPRRAHPMSPTDVDLAPGAEGTLGVSPDWLYRNA